LQTGYGKGKKEEGISLTARGKRVALVEQKKGRKKVALRRCEGRS